MNMPFPQEHLAALLRPPLTGPFYCRLVTQPDDDDEDEDEEYDPFDDLIIWH